MKLLLENWRKFLTEGKAIEINPSMRRWVDGAWNAYTNAEKLKYNQPFYSGTIDGYDDEKIEVNAIIVKAPNFRWNGKGAVEKKTLGTNKQTVKFFQTTEGALGWNPDSFEGLVLHELIHVIDPKFKLDPKKHPWHRTHRDPIKYYNSPHEQDAFMRQSVEDLKSDYGKITKEMVKNYEPASGYARPWEKVWYETNPKAWRKFLLTLYAAIDEELL
tara:strand:- start:40 stop:687 length:648 start_codon:yes stop_codon:yes gene_type:complete